MPNVSAAPDMPSTVCIEAMSGDAALTKQFVNYGFIGRAFERDPDNSGVLPEGDLNRVENQIDIGTEIINRRVYHVHLAPNNSSFTCLLNADPTLSTRTRENPQGGWQFAT